MWNIVSLLQWSHPRPLSFIYRCMFYDAKPHSTKLTHSESFTLGMSAWRLILNIKGNIIKEFSHLVSKMYRSEEIPRTMHKNGFHSNLGCANRGTPFFNNCEATRL